ncbi:hypothetical protein Hanom_Chr10g00911991 [Helianthus anomalus]
MERQFHDYVSEKTLDLQKIATAKDKKIPQLEKENNTLQKELLLAEITANKERLEVIDGAKHSAAIMMLKIKLQMAKEAADPSFDRSEWDVEAQTKRLAELGDDEEPEEVLALEAGGSGAKDPEDTEAAGGSGKGGEEKVNEAVKVLAA